MVTMIKSINFQIQPQATQYENENIAQQKMGKKILRKGKRPNKSLTQLYDKITHMQTDILSRFQRLKLLPKLKWCPHLHIQSTFPIAYQPEINYYDLYWKRFFLNEIGKSHITTFSKQIEYLSKRLLKVQELFKSRRLLLQPYEKKKHMSMKSSQSEQHNYQCTICKKDFDDVQALFLHREIKHQEMRHEQEPMKKEESIYEQQQEIHEKHENR